MTDDTPSPIAQKSAFSLFGMITKMITKDLTNKVATKISKARKILKKPYQIEVQHKKELSKRTETDPKRLQTTQSAPDLIKTQPVPKES